MKNTIYRTILVMLISAFMAIGVAAQCTDAQKAELTKFTNDYEQAFEKRDKATVQAMLSDNYHSFYDSGMVDKAWILENRFGPDDKAVEAVRLNDNFYITCSGDSAVLTHRNENIRKENGIETTNYFRSVHIFQKTGSKWKLIASASNDLSDSDNLRYMEQGGLEAYRRRDSKWFEKNLHEDYLSIEADGKITRKPDLLTQIKNDKNTYDVMRIWRIRVKIMGDAATLIVNMYEKGKSADGKPFERQMLTTRNLVKENGKWLAMSSHHTIVPPSN